MDVEPQIWRADGKAMCGLSTAWWVGTPIPKLFKDQLYISLSNRALLMTISNLVCLGEKKRAKMTNKEAVVFLSFSTVFLNKP